MQCLCAVIVHFVERVDQSLNALGPHPQFAVDENGFVHATSLVYDGVRNVRHAVLQNRVHFIIIITISFISGNLACRTEKKVEQNRTNIKHRHTRTHKNTEYKISE